MLVVGGEEKLRKQYMYLGMFSTKYSNSMGY